MKNKHVAIQHELTCYNTSWPKVIKPAPSSMHQKEHWENDSLPVLLKLCQFVVMT